MNTIKISTAFWSDHSSRLWQSKDGVIHTHIDAGLQLEVVKETDKQTTLRICTEGVKELYADASYQCENAEGAYRALTRRAMAAIRKQVELPAEFIRYWQAQ